jgi:integrase
VAFSFCNQLRFPILSDVVTVKPVSRNHWTIAEGNSARLVGYHAFRRGLATNLRALSVDDLTISEILRHSDVKVTRASYIKRVDEKSVEAMNRFEVELAKPAKGKGFQPKADAIIPADMA